MLELNNDKEKNITFEISLSGISPKELNGYFRILVDGIEYGFPAEISESSISVDVPSLKNVIHRTLRENEKFQSKLEVFGNGNYLNPWSGEVKIKSTIMIEAKIVESESKPIISIRENTGDKPNSKKQTIKESKIVKAPFKKTKKEVIVVTMDHLRRFMETKGTKDKKIQEIILETCTNKVGDSNLKILFRELYNYYKTTTSKKLSNIRNNF